MTGRAGAAHPGRARAPWIIGETPGPPAIEVELDRVVAHRRIVLRLPRSGRPPGFRCHAM